MMETTLKDHYFYFVNEIKEKIHNAQYEALKQVNTALLNLYWEIGKSIVEKQKQFGWGKSIVVTLSRDLQIEFPGVQGYSSRNLWYMRNFYQLYHENSKLQPLVAEIGWSHNLVILNNCKDDLEREFYLKMTIQNGWSKNILINQIESKSYEKYLLNQTNFEKINALKNNFQAKLAVKDDYNFEFLDIGNLHTEKQLEQALLKNMRQFLLELGSDFALKSTTSPIGVAKYTLTSTLPNAYKNLLPSPKEIEENLGGLITKLTEK